MVTGKEFRMTLRRPLPGAAAKCGRGPRVVPAFTIQSLQRDTVVEGPPRCGAYKQRPLRPTVFRKYYRRGDFPISMETDSSGNKIAWKVTVTSFYLLDNYYSRTIIFYSCSLII